jgi:putative NADH-flavin reductase
MRVAILGGTGGIGGQLLTWALNSGHDVTALARNPAALAAQAALADHGALRDHGALAGQGALAGRSTARASNAGTLTLISGDATDGSAMRAAIDGADAVLSALGPRGARTPGLLGTAAANLTVAMEKAGVRRVICVSAAGPFIADDPDMGAVIKMILPRVFAKPFADTRDMEAVISATDLDWTLVRASRLVDKPGTGRYRVRPDYAPAGGRKIARADVAHFMAAVLTEGSWLRARPAVAY